MVGCECRSDRCSKSWCDQRFLSDLAARSELASEKKLAWTKIENLMNLLGLDSLLASEKVLPFIIFFFLNIYKSVDHCLQVKYTRYTQNHLGLGYSVEKK